VEAHLFEGNKSERRTLIPVLTSFRSRHDVDDIVVVADAGMLSAGNLLALEDAGFEFIVGSRISKAPYDLAEQFETRGNHFADGQTLEVVRPMGVGKDKRLFNFERGLGVHAAMGVDAPRVWWRPSGCCSHGLRELG